MTNRGMHKIIVVGCGLHFKERHFKVLDNFNSAKPIQIILAIDLISEKEKILHFFSRQKLIPKDYLFLSEKYRNSITIEEIEEGVRSKKINLNEINGILICTEPKAHKPYALWAIRHGLHVFSDKPLTTFSSLDEMNCLYNDYLEIFNATKKHNVNFVLCCERREHLGYRFLKEYIGNIVKQFKVPITFIDIHYGDGLWNMPDEYFLRENHPYKYGYGVLLHSGYHYIDLLMNLVALNDPIERLSIDECDMHIFGNTPFNTLAIIKNDVYVDLLKTNRFTNYFDQHSLEKMRSFGETDVVITGRFRKGVNVITNFNLKLLQSTVSQRSWDVLPENTYLGNGRTHQENLIIHIGPLCSIQLRINPYSKMAPDIYKKEGFSIEIMNNPKLLNTQPVIQICREDISKMYPELAETESMNIKSRGQQLQNFLENRKGNSSLNSHGVSIQFIDKIFKKIHREILNENWP